MPVFAHAGERVLIPAETFQMGCSSGDPACENDEGPAGGTAVSVPAFMLDTHEVTVAEYRACGQRGGVVDPAAQPVLQL